MTKVSAVIPAFNAERFIEAAISSALAQNHPSTEVVVVDDGSTDQTPRILQSFGTRIRVVSQQNAGTAEACNRGVREASGDYVAFLDADDLWEQNKISQQLASMVGVDISHTDSWVFGDTLRQPVLRSSVTTMHQGDVLEHLLVDNFITKSTVMIRRETFLSAGGFSSRYPAVEDWPLWISICAKHALAYIPQPLTRYRVHPASKSMAARRTAADHLRIINDAFSPSGVGAALPHLKRHALASSLRINAHYAGQSGDWRFALNCISRALVREPQHRESWKVAARALLMPFGRAY